MISWTEPAPSSLQKKARWWYAPLALRYFSRSNKRYGNAMSCLWPVVCGSNNAVVIRRVVISGYTKVKSFSWNSARPKEDFLLHATSTPRQLKYTKLKNNKIRLSITPLLVFNRKFTISELKSKIVSHSFGKLSRTVGIENWCATHYATEVEWLWHIKALHT